MSLLKVRRFSQITLPAKVRRKFKLSEGDCLKVKEIKEGILLTPVEMVEKELAWEKVFKAMEGVKDKKPRKQKLFINSLPLFELPFQKRNLAVPVINNNLMVVVSS
ncbi:MAG: AbrB/MazE/SpoVT family DNA-binding domain-containing protein [Nitrospirae bacterium]|nr:AbrB/MazE/SpoVT family DNA-binding domain-containing protein [Nitrospirota bacterium]MBI5096907.1 AbrB/MazE/SpoVT family DNA-binding domain-containing protein [Nitrospirota bacterium]